MMKHLPKLTAYWRKYNAGIVWALTDEEVEKLYNEVGRTSIYRVFFFFFTGTPSMENLG